MSFTRAAMSAARCIKLLHMMGLHRLDDPDAEFEMAPTIAPPRDWTELEGESEILLLEAMQSPPSPPRPIPSRL